MSEEARAAEEVVVEVEGKAPDVDIEAEARDMGWMGREKFKGDEKDFIDAAEFVRRGKEFVPFLRANNRKLEGEVQGLKKTLEKFAAHHSKTEERAYARALADLETRQAEAVEANDGAAVKEITKEIVDLNKEAAGKGKTAADEPDTSVVDDWRADNPWYDKDEALQAAAYGIAEKIKGDFPDQAKQLAEVTRRIKAAFPEKFTNPRRTQAAAVEGVQAGGKGAGKTYSDLPADAKKMCDEFVRDIKGFSKDKYVKDYFG